jgi:hypothetical protein
LQRSGFREWKMQFRPVARQIGRETRHRIPIRKQRGPRERTSLEAKRSTLHITRIHTVPLSRSHSSSSFARRLCWCRLAALRLRKQTNQVVSRIHIAEHAAPQRMHVYIASTGRGRHLSAPTCTCSSTLPQECMQLSRSGLPRGPEEGVPSRASFVPACPLEGPHVAWSRGTAFIRTPAVQAFSAVPTLPNKQGRSSRGKIEFWKRCYYCLGVTTVTTTRRPWPKHW